MALYRPYVGPYRPYLFPYGPVPRTARAQAQALPSTMRDCPVPLSLLPPCCGTRMVLFVLQHVRPLRAQNPEKQRFRSQIGQSFANIGPNRLSIGHTSFLAKYQYQYEPVRPWLQQCFLMWWEPCQPCVMCGNL